MSVLTPAQLRATGAAVAAEQEPDGAIPWTGGDKTDVWNHVEAAMALLVTDQVDAAHRAYDWCLATQRPDGSWPMKIVVGSVEDHSGESNMTAYLAVGVWHHWLVRREKAFVEHCWPAVRAGLDWVVGLQQPFGGIAWSQEHDADGTPGRVNVEAMLAGSSSIYQALRSGLALAEVVGDGGAGGPVGRWSAAAGRLGHALRRHRDLFADKSTFSMDWYYPVLGGAVRGIEAQHLLASRWDDFVVPGLGIRCVDTNPWVTGAETCELVLALEASGDRDRALRLFGDMQHLRDPGGGYWTGYVYDDEVRWPHETTTYTAAAVVLAAEALEDLTPGADLMRGTLLGPRPPEPPTCPAC